MACDYPIHGHKFANRNHVIIYAIRLACLLRCAKLNSEQQDIRTSEAAISSFFYALIVMHTRHLM